jgi:hypothetical protein
MPGPDGGVGRQGATGPRMCQHPIEGPGSPGRIIIGYAGHSLGREPPEAARKGLADLHIRWKFPRYYWDAPQAQPKAEPEAGA